MLTPQKVSPSNCDWFFLYDEEERLYLLNGLTKLAYGCAAFTFYFLLFPHHKYLKIMPKIQQSVCTRYSYRNLNYFYMAIHIRNLLVLFTLKGLFPRIVEDFITTDVCSLFGVLETFLSVFEVEMLTHLCIERYVVAKYISKGWPLNEKHYAMYVHLTVFFAVLYAVVPLLRLGWYGQDLTCTLCGYDLILPQDWLKFPMLIVWVLRSLKPAFFMIMMLIWACQLEKKYDSDMLRHADKNLTKVIIGLTALNLTCWLPLALLKAWILVSQLLYDAVFIRLNWHLRWAVWIHAAAPMMNMIGRVLIDYLAQENIYFNCEENCDKITKKPTNSRLKKS